MEQSLSSALLLLIIIGIVALILLVCKLSYQAGYMTAVEERFEETDHNQDY
jgi:hypothetical protein